MGALPGRTAFLGRAPSVGRSNLLVLFLLLAAVLTGGCAGSYADNPFQGGSSDDDVQVTIRNQNFNDATIWAEWRGGSRTRLGSVTGSSTRTFSTPFRGDVIRFEVDFLGGRRYMTESYPINPGDHLQVTIRP